MIEATRRAYDLYMQAQMMTIAAALILWLLIEWAIIPLMEREE